MHNKSKTFAEFNDFRRHMNNKVFFMEKTPGVFVQEKEFRVESYFIPPVEDIDINSLCWNLRDDLENFTELSF